MKTGGKMALRRTAGGGYRTEPPAPKGRSRAAEVHITVAMLV